MKLRNGIFITALGLVLCTTGMPSPGAEAASPSTPCGYYHSDDRKLIFMDDETIFESGSESEKAELLTGFTVEMDETSYLITFGETDRTLLVEQTEREASPDGGVYYAVYDDYIGDVGSVPYDEGESMLFENHIFSKEYEEFVREPLSVYFGIDQLVSLDASAEGEEETALEEAQAAVEPFRYEGSGFDTPEEALAAYIHGLQNQDFYEMLSCFAVETYMENFEFVHWVGVLGAYAPASFMMIPSISDLSKELNIQIRLSEILYDVRYQYLALTNPDLDYAEHPISLSIYDVTSKTGEGLIREAFTDNDSAVLSSLEFNNDFIDPDMVSDEYTDTAQTKLNIMQLRYGVEDIQSVVALIKVNSKGYLLCANVGKYGEKWYLFSFTNYISNYSLIPVTEEEISTFLKK